MQVLSGTGSNVVRLSGVVRQELQTDIKLVHGGASSRSMVEGILEEAGLPTRDVVAGLSAKIGYVMGCFERGYGTDATVLRYRKTSTLKTVALPA